RWPPRRSRPSSSSRWGTAARRWSGRVAEAGSHAGPRPALGRPGDLTPATGSAARPRPIARSCRRYRPPRASLAGLPVRPRPARRGPGAATAGVGPAAPRWAAASLAAAARSVADPGTSRARRYYGAVGCDPDWAPGTLAGRMG